MGSVAVTRLKRATSSLKSARSRPWPDASSEPQGPELLPLIIRRWRTLGARPRRCGRQASIRDRSAYGKPNRTTSADRDGLALYTSALMEFLKETPTSFPCQQGVRQALLILAEIYQILGCEPRFAIKVASGAADLWRVVLKDLHDLRRKDIFVPPLKELLDLIEFPSSCGFEFGDGVHDTDDGPLRIPAMATISAHPALATCEAGDAAMADATLGDAPVLADRGSSTMQPSKFCSPPRARGEFRVRARPRRSTQATTSLRLSRNSAAAQIANDSGMCAFPAR